jgi:hypothetical protein
MVSSPGSDGADESCRLLDAVGNVAEEAGSDGAVTDAVVEHQGELGELADGELAVDHPGPVENAAHAEDRDLGVIDDRGGAVHAEDAVVVQGEGAAG